jgi:VWFA-related protein
VRRVAIIACVGILSVTGWLAAETETDQEVKPVGGLAFVDEVEVTVVNVDVYVRDGKGRPVEGLTKEDFVISQDGVEMPITNFAVLDQRVYEHALQEVDMPGATPSPAPDAAERSNIRPIYVVLYIDNENIHPLQRNRVIRNVREFVVESLIEPVQMMVVSFERSLKIVQPFSNSTREVNQALSSMTRYSGGRVERDNARSKIMGRMAEVTEDSNYSDDSGNRTAAEISIKNEIMAYAEEEVNNLNFTLSGIRQTLAMISGIDGRKSIVYVSSGLPMTPGLGLMYEYASVFRDSSILSRRSQVDRTRDFQSLAATANGQEVSLYTIDATGLNPIDGIDAEYKYSRDPTAASIGMKNFQDSLKYLADATGGIAVVNTNDPSLGLAKIREDLFTYYSIGYTLSSSGRDRVHRIKVELPGHKGYELRYRRRFIEKSLETQVQDRVFSSLMVDIDDNPMSLRVAADDPAPASGERWTVPLHLSFPIDKVALIPEAGEYVGRLVLFLGARDIKGRNSELQRQEHEIRVPAEDLERARDQRFGIDLQLLLEESQHRIAVGVMDRVTRQSSYERVVVTVP